MSKNFYTNLNNLKTTFNNDQSFTFDDLEEEYQELFDTQERIRNTKYYYEQYEAENDYY